jgi:hypothetical protein
MNSQTLCAILAAWLAACGLALADQHTEEALRHAEEAASSTGDSKAISEHANEALKHIDAAKAGVAASDPEAFKRLRKSEADLKAAVQNAQRFNADTAAKDAKDAKDQLESLKK